MTSSRRSFLTGLFGSKPPAPPTPAVTTGAEGAANGSGDTAAPPAAAPGDLLAIVQGRHCLAAKSFCRTCLERCPVPGAMVIDHGLPMVVPSQCTGCGVCQQVCPAPTNAILMLRRKPGMPRPGGTEPGGAT
jgi:Pyruvate/2-oxoacid:ferredoxin oxidoreductase delta subunit